jgi:hypothetical protein
MAKVIPTRFDHIYIPSLAMGEVIRDQAAWLREQGLLHIWGNSVPARVDQAWAAWEAYLASKQD